MPADTDVHRIEDRIKRSPSLRPSTLPAQLDQLREENRHLRNEVQKKDRLLFRYRQRLAKVRKERERMNA